MSEEATGAVTTAEAGADTHSQTAEVGGTQEVTDTGADTQETATAEGQGEKGADSNTEEGAEGAAEEQSKDKGSHQKTFEERMAEIERKNEEKLARMLEEKLAERKPEAPPFIPVDYDAYDAHIASLVEAEEELRSQISLNPEEKVQLVRQLREVRGKREELETAFLENEKKRLAWEKQSGEQQRQQEVINSINKAIADASPVVRDGMGIDPAVWDAGEKWFMEQRRVNPLLDAEYRERCFNGPFQALKWAAQYVKENMGKAAEAAKQQREQGKEKTVGSGGEGTGSTFANIHSYGDLLKLPGNQINEFYKQHPKRFQELKARHFK
jgi:hypothetical protein